MYSKVLFEQIPDDAAEPGGPGKSGRTKKTSPPTSPTSTTSSKRANSNSPRKEGGSKNKDSSPSASGKKKPVSPRSSAGDSMIAAEKLDGTLNSRTTRELAAAQSTSSRRLSFRGSNKNNSSGGAKSSSKKNKSSPRSPSNRLGASMDVLDTAPPGGDEDDPVMVLFQSRNTQKVRFSLGDTVPKERGGGGGDTSSNNGGGGALERRDSSGRLMKLSGGGGGGGDSPRASFNIKKFMKGALFGTSSNGTKTDIKDAQSEEYAFELTKEVEAVKKQNNEISWSSADRPDGAAGADDGMLAGAEALSPSSSIGNGGDGFPEDRETRATVIKLLNKARRAQFLHYRYPYAVKCYVRSLELLKEAQYPDDHPTVVKTIKLLQAAHFANSSFTNSANIVKLGIKYEDTGELVRALKMYTIAYRIRRDNLSGSHPSLVVLLNMLGSIQIKRGELEEAMQIFKLALKDTTTTKNCPNNSSSGDESTQSPPPPSPVNYLTRAVTYREMGCVHEEWGEIEMAHNMYHASLECMAEYKGIVFQKPAFVVQHGDGSNIEEKKLDGEALILHDLEETRLAVNDEANDHEDEGEEVPFLAAGKKSRKKWHSAAEGTTHTTSTPSRYDVFFPASLEEKKSKKRLGKKHQEKTEEKRGDHTDVDVALTIHRIAQLHRTQQEYQLALPAFYVSLRGMKYALGKSHPNVAAILGNIGNLLKEMGDMNAAYTTYQQVLAIESYRLGLSHPDVVVTLHNIATIDAARGNLEHALSLYTQVVNLQRKLFGEDHESVAVTSACMGDVHERLGDNKTAVELYEEALRIKIAALGRHALEVARLLHKLGKLAVVQGDYHLAESYITKASLVYRLNKLHDDDEWMVDVNRDHADVEAAIAMGRGHIFEC